MPQQGPAKSGRSLSLILMAAVVVVLVVVAAVLGAEMVSVQSQVSSLQNQTSSLQAQVTSVQSQNANLQSQVSNLQSQNTNLQSQVSSLQSQVTNANNLLGLTVSTTEANQVTINQAAGQTSTITTFTASYAGYIHVTGTSTTTNGFIQVTDTFYIGGNPTNYQFGTGSTADIAVLPGTVTVSFGNTNFSSGATATITVVYYS